MAHHPRPRLRIQRAFLDWWHGNRHRLKVPVHLESVTHHGIRLRFTGEHACLHACLSSTDLSVIAEVNGEYWDMLVSLDAYPVRMPEGYRCSHCGANDPIWPSREAQWTDHLFEPFLQWVNGRLAHSCGVELGGTPGGSTWAELAMQSGRSIEALAGTAMSALSALQAKQVHPTGTPTGLFDLDRMTGGFQPGQLYVIAARPGMGKTSFVLGALVHAAVALKQAAAYYSTSHDLASLTQRMLAQVASVPLSKLGRDGLNETEWSSIQNAAATLSAAAMHLTQASILDTKHVAQCAKQAVQQHGELALLVVDGLQPYKSMLVKSRHLSNRAPTASDGHTVTMEAALQELKELAVQLRCPTVITWQLGPEIDQRLSKRPTFADLHLTQTMEHAIDSVMILFKEDAYRQDDGWNGVTDLFVVRNRNGVTGTVRLAHDVDHAKFRALALPVT